MSEKQGKKQRVTIKDVAERAGLSPATVSRALNKSGYVSEEAHQRIEKAVAELGYQPNWMARSLRGKPSRSIGLIIPDILNVFYTTIAKAVAEALRLDGYELILCLNDEDPETDLGYLKTLWQKQVDGVIYVHPAQGDNSRFVRQMARSGMPIVEMTRQREEGLLDAVLAEDFRGAYQVTEYLTGLGHRRIGFIVGSTELSTGRRRVDGYRRALEDANIPTDPDLLRIGTFTRDHGEEATRALLALPEPPTAIFAGSNRILVGLLYVLRCRGWQIPEDVSVATFDDAEWLGVWCPPITAVDVAIDEMAQLAVDLLLRRMACPDKKPVTYRLNTTLIERTSCKEL
ncbi:MAG: LacI family DNA-binding transcriptional regulator [Anaerolineae bacterium]